MDTQKIIKGLESALKAERNKRQEYQKLLAIADKLLKENFVWQTIQGISSYSGSYFESLSLKEKCLTSLSWDLYPDNSFTDLIANLEQISPELADALKNKGIVYFIDENGQCIIANEYIIWYDDLLPAQLIKSLQKDEAWQEIEDAIYQFASKVAIELKNYLAENNSSVSDFDILD